MSLRRIAPLVGPALDVPARSLGFCLICVFDENVRQMTRMSRRKHKMIQPAGVELRGWMADYDFIAIVRHLYLHKPSYFVHLQLPSVYRN
jgi:hypothetical protein